MSGKSFVVEPKHILQSSISNQTLRDWQGIKCVLTAKNLMYPLFIVEDDNAVQPIASMPGISRLGLNKLREHLDPIVENGLTSILLFGVIDNLAKDDNASNADSKQNPVIRALPKLRSWYPDLTIACDVCLCPYSSHGHCGILFPDGTIDNTTSIERIAEVALSYAKAGAHIVAPSDMMDGRIGAIKDQLIKHNLANKVAVLSYTAKFASSFYGPFRCIPFGSRVVHELLRNCPKEYFIICCRDAAKSAPAFGDRKCYQLPPTSAGLAIRAADRDVSEGADMLMVKPVMAYMDILKQVKDKYPHYPMFVYQVSGEYLMIYTAAQNGAFNLQTALTEILMSLRRAGADVIISYYTPLVLKWLKPKHKL